MLRVGIVGCGTIGSYLAAAINKKYRGKIRLSGICEPDAAQAAALERLLKKKIRRYALAALVRRSDLIIEAAGAEVVRGVIEQAAAAGKDVMIMSVGGLLLYPQLLKKVKQRKIHVYVPSGAVAGLDALKAARKGTITRVTLTTKKPVEGLAGAPYLRDNAIDLDGIKKERVIFEGSAREAVTGFPKNINVAAILSLAGIGPEKTRVCIIASRLIKRNIHTIEIEGDFGTIVSRVENVSSETNPKTSKLAMLSALATLDGILGDVRIGT
jgi:aspartate dehydrogenase